MSEAGDESDFRKELLADVQGPSSSRKAIRRAGEFLAASEIDERSFNEGLAYLDEQTANLDESNLQQMRELQERIADSRAWLTNYRILNNWRAAHLVPLGSIYLDIAEAGLLSEPHAIGAVRLKRLPSILAKLRRFEGMSLERMQDLGGCRLVVDSLAELNALLPKLKDVLSGHDIEASYDYVATPKPDGYRSVHVVYKFNGPEEAAAFKGLRIEVQLRTRLQHSWATAVETVDLFQRERLKGGEGDERWRRFFRLASDALASLEPGIASIHGGFSGTDRHELAVLIEEMAVFERFENYKSTLTHVLKHDGPLTFLMSVDIEKHALTIQSFESDKLEEAQSAYSAAEQNARPDDDVVLVSVQSANELRTAYPNYFADTTSFLDALRAVCGSDGDAC